MKVRVQRVNDSLYLDFGDYRELVLNFGWKNGWYDDPENVEIVTETAGFFINSPHKWIECEKFSTAKKFLNSLQRDLPRVLLPWDKIDGIEDLDPVSYEAYKMSWEMFMALRRELFAKFGMDYDDPDRCAPTIIEI